MHRHLVLTTSHQLAQTSLSRLQSFRSLDITSSTLVEAQTRVEEAEKEVYKASVSMRNAFTGLWRLTEGFVGEKGLEGVEWEGLKERLVRLEEGGTLPPGAKAQRAALPPEPKGSIPPALPTPAIEEPPAKDDIEMADPSNSGFVSEARQAKRNRARELLEDVLTRVDGMERMRQGFEDRFEEFENHLFLGQGAEMDKIRGWGDLERQKDPTGRLRGITEESRKGKEKEKDDVENQGWDEVERRSDYEVGRAGMEDGVNGDGGQVSVEIKILQEEVSALKDEVALLKEEKERNNREVIEAIMEGMRDDYASIARKVRGSLLAFRLILPEHSELM